MGLGSLRRRCGLQKPGSVRASVAEPRGEGSFRFWVPGAGSKNLNKGPYHGANSIYLQLRKPSFVVGSLQFSWYLMVLGGLKEYRRGPTQAN